MSRTMEFTGGHSYQWPIVIMKSSLWINSKITALYSTASYKQYQVEWGGGVTKDEDDLKRTPQNKIVLIMFMEPTVEFVYLI